jgi:DNA-binding transcriptional MocR family regulator
MDAIRYRVTSRALAPGERLPSIRGLAAALAVSPSTVVEAYDRLAAQGLIRARRGSGFYVAGAPPLLLAQARSPRDREIDPLWVSRQSLDADAAAPKPGCGWLPPDWLPADALRRALRALARADAGLLVEYGGVQGAPALRRVLLSRLAEDGVQAAPGQLLLTASATQSLDLICRFLLRPGDTVLLDDPCYFNFQALLRAHRVTVTGVPRAPDGPDMAAFETILATQQPRLYVTNSALHNPTGASLLPQAAHRLLNAAAAHGLTIVEDDVFNDFEPEPSPRLAALDGLNRVIRIGSFSKTLSASVRCGYIAARADWIEGLIDLQVATGFGGPSPVAAQAIAHVLTGGGYRGHMEELRRKLARARRLAADKLDQLGIRPWLLPRGGFFLWCRLPGGRDAAQVAQKALAENVVLAPGNVFSVSRTAPDFMRFNVAQQPRAWDVLARALRAAE